MTLRIILEQILNEEEDYFPYLKNIMPYIISNKKDFDTVNDMIIKMPENKKNYKDYFCGKSIKDFRKEVINASIQLVENPNKNITAQQQHLIISYLDNYINKIRSLKQQGILNFIE